MEKITVNIKELKKIKYNLKKSNEAWDPLVTGIEACLLEEDWTRISAIERPVIKSLEIIRRILQSVEECK